MTTRLFGLETEYAFTATCKPGHARPQERIVEQFMEFFKNRATPRLSDGTAYGFFTQNSTRYYVDCGHHIEQDSPECTSPTELVRYQLAGEQVLSEMADAFLCSDGTLADLAVGKGNVCYSGSGATFGSHESYCHSAEPELLPAQLVPHLVSRVVFTGAGGFNSQSSGLQFTLSPRSFHIVREVSSESTRDRGIYHSKDEPLSRRYHRLHVIVGESLCSQTAQLLRFGTTSLLLALVEAGLRPGDDVRLRRPLQALRTFAADPQCQATVELLDGRRVTACEIQRHYLAAVEARLDDLPLWAGAVCQAWRRTLDLLGQGPAAVAARLDWAIKYALYRDAVQNSGFAWESLPVWNELMRRIKTLLNASPLQGQRVSVDQLLSSTSPIAEGTRQLTPWLKRHGLRWDDLGRFIALRGRMLETDTRFSQLGPRGLFSALDRAGQLDHRADEVGDIETAAAVSPDVGRARLRGDMICRLARETGPFVCGWTAVMDLGKGRMYDLEDPFCSTGSWVQRAADEIPEGMPPDMAVFMRMRSRRIVTGTRRGF